MIDLLKTMIEASKAATLPLEMSKWHYGTSCCLCGDVAVYQNPVCTDDAILWGFAEQFALRLESKSIELFGSVFVASSIFVSAACFRHAYARDSGIFTDEEIEHPHLTTDHSDRDIAIDYIELVMRKCEKHLNK